LQKAYNRPETFFRHTVYCASKMFCVSFDFLLKASKTIITSRRG